MTLFFFFFKEDVKAQGSGSVQNLIRMMLEFSTPQLDQGNEQMSMESG